MLVIENTTPMEQERIDTLMGFMGRFIGEKMVRDLQEKGFFLAPASIITAITRERYSTIRMR